MLAASEGGSTGVGGGFASASYMLVRVIRQPFGFANGVSLRQFKPGQTYDVDPSVADYLVVEGFAVIEMRRGQRSKRLRPKNRRKQ